MLGWGKGWLTEAGKFVNITPPIDKNGATTASLWVNFKNNKRATFVIATGVCAGITPPAVTLNQATDSLGTGSKALAFDTILQSLGQSQAAAGDAVTSIAVVSNTFTIPATSASLTMINIRDDQLDINNSFNYVQVSIVSPGASACLIAILAILYDADNSGKESTLPSVVFG